MKRFSVEADNNKKTYQSFKKKPKNEATVLHLIKLHPYALVAQFNQGDDDNLHGYTADLKKAIDNKAEWLKEFELLPHDFDRRVPGIKPPQQYKFKEKYSWRVFVHILSDSEMNDVDNFADKFGKKLAKAFNDNISKRWDYPKKTEFAGVKNKGKKAVIDNLPSYLMPHSVVAYCKYCFESSIKTGAFFKNNELMELLFPGVENPSYLFF